MYRAIADVVAEAVEAGALAPGERLPTHRALARELGVTVGTVSRGYEEAARRGLVVGEVGRGTFVRAGQASGWAVPGLGSAAGRIDLAFNVPPGGSFECATLSDALRELAAEPDLGTLLHYRLQADIQRERAAGARWLEPVGLELGPERVLVTAGAQHGMTVAFGTLLRPGDAVAVESLTYPGMKSLARLLRLELVPIALDEHGLVPEALDRACAGGTVRALYCVPTIQNPTTAVMPQSRRREVADVVRSRELYLVEDDIHAHLPEERHMPISAHVPERSCYIVSLGKTVAGGLRVGYLAAARELVERLDAGIRATTWMPSPITAELATRWVLDGTADALLLERRRRIRSRRALAAELLEGWSWVTAPDAMHLWLTLPKPWRSADFVAEADQRGVAVRGADTFAVGRDEPPHAVRICLGAPSTEELLREGLGVLRDMLETGPRPIASVA